MRIVPILRAQEGEDHVLEVDCENIGPKPITIHGKDGSMSPVELHLEQNGEGVKPTLIACYGYSKKGVRLLATYEHASGGRKSLGVFYRRLRPGKYEVFATYNSLVLSDLQLTPIRIERQLVAYLNVEPKTK